jgi:hypothetical protein
MPKTAKLSPATPVFSESPEAAPAERERERWGMCAGCGKERPLDPGPVVTQHRAWRTWQQVMVRCEGSGDAPTVVTA